MQFTPRPYQAEAIDAGVSFLKSDADYNAFLILPTGCHAKGTLVLMYDGSVKRVEDIKIGDQLMGPDSKPRKVLKLCRGREEMYQINPISGAPFIVNANHILHLVSTSEGKKAICPSHQNGGEIQHLSVQEYLGKSKSWKHLRKLSRSATIHFPSQNNLPIDPYFLGLFLGDGSSMNGIVSITTMDKSILETVLNEAQRLNMDIRLSTKKNTSAVSLYMTKKVGKRDKTVQNPFAEQLRKLGLMGAGSGTKFVPPQYKTADYSHRLELLAGLIDTDGYHDGAGSFDFISKSQLLANDLAFIARSLGFSASLKVSYKTAQTGVTGTYYRVQLSGNPHDIPCRLKRKQMPLRRQKKNVLRTGFTVEPAGIDDFYGFTLNKDHLYLTDDFMIHHNSGKSIVIANTAKELEGKTLVFQPSKEILEQNYMKYLSYGFRAGIFSASAGTKFIDTVTFATIGSVHKKAYLFKDVRNIIIDECHLVDAQGGMYSDFISKIPGARVLGMTATPYRLTSGFEGAKLCFINRTRPRIFRECLYYIQNEVLFSAGHLAKLEYFNFNLVDRTRLQMNSQGSDFTEASMRAYFREINMEQKTVHYALRLMQKRRNLLVFCSLIAEANKVSAGIPGSKVLHGKTPSADRSSILRDFKAGRLKVLINVGVLTTGFDYPELECVLIARSTMSLALFYQIVGRGMRPHPKKESCWIVDLAGNVSFFGKIETMQIREHKGLLSIWNDGKQLTDIPFSKN